MGALCGEVSDQPLTVAFPSPASSTTPGDVSEITTYVESSVCGPVPSSRLTSCEECIGGKDCVEGWRLDAYDPVQLQGAWPRTKWARPEAELTFERPIADLGKFVLFGNGTYQRAYKNGYSSSGPSYTAAKGVTYGGRLELGRVHIGASGLWGYGLGLNYALENSDASMDLATNMRKSDGYYVQAQVAVGKVDLMASWGITRIFLTDYDNTKIVSSADPTVSYYQFSIIKHQMGMSAGAVYHVRPWLHADVDVFRADFAWFLGQKQVINVANAGMMFTW
jgi:hypothetical protein